MAILIKDDKFITVTDCVCGIDDCAAMHWHQQHHNFFRAAASFHIYCVDGTVCAMCYAPAHNSFWPCGSFWARWNIHGVKLHAEMNLFSDGDRKWLSFLVTPPVRSQLTPRQFPHSACKYCAIENEKQQWNYNIIFRRVRINPELAGSEHNSCRCKMPLPVIFYTYIFIYNIHMDVLYI